MKRPKFHLNRGVSLIEVVVALALFSFVISSFFGTQWAIGALIQNSTRQVLASNIANLDLLVTTANSVQAAPNFFMGITSQNTNQPFTRCQLTISSESVWQTGWQTTSTSSISVVKSNLALADQYGKDCGGQPKKFLDSDFELESTVDLNEQTSSIDMLTDKTVIALRSSSELEPDIAVRDSDGQMFYLDIGPGINKIDAADHHAFAAVHSSSSQLAIFDTNSAASPALIATSSLPGVAGARPEAVSIFYFDSRVYIGTKRTAGHEFHIFDVSNPAAPRWLGSREINHNINDIAVKDGLAFLATSGNIRDLIVLDVRDPGNITQLIALDLPGNEDGRSVFVSGNFIFLGRYRSTVPDRHELHVLSYQIKTDGSIEINPLDSIATQADVTGLVAAGNLVFASTAAVAKEFQIFSIDKNKRLTLVGERDLNAPATAIDTSGGVVSLVAGSALYIFNQN